MERKRKMPARAASRVEHVAKKRTSTPPERSLTPAPQSASQSVEPAAVEPQLPKSVQAGQPLPTVENAQGEDLSHKDFQSVQESGVLAESLTRSRQKWINEGIFEKYWTKPVKRKGVVKEEANNPPKDSMMKIGTITITVEPHVIEATMFAIKDPRPPALTANAARPILQYGPPNGIMPPPPKPQAPTTPSTPAGAPASMWHAPSPAASPAPLPGSAPGPSSAQPLAAPPASPLAQPPQFPPQPQLPAQQPQVGRPPTPSQVQPTQTLPQGPTQLQQPHGHPPPAAAPGRPIASPRGLESVLAPPGIQSVTQPPHSTQPPLRSPAPLSAPSVASPLVQPSAGQPGYSVARPPHAQSPRVSAAAPSPLKPPTPVAKPATPTTPTHASGSQDPIIVTLAGRASEDPKLRDLMKRVALGQAPAPELTHFQKIIDDITKEYKQNGALQGPSADKLLIGGRTVKYFADEVRTILDIVLHSNPSQRSADLRPPPSSDPLVILLVKKALDDEDMKNLVKRVAEGRTKFSDATDLKFMLDRLKEKIVHEPAKPSVSNYAPQSPAVPGPDSVMARKSSTSSTAALPANPGSQALRSKGPPPPAKPDISAIVLEFAGGTGDRYMFPKYSVLEYQPGGSQVLASFLIVRKGSKAEYGGDPALDYYQPITIRLSSPSAKNLDLFARIVAPREEVQRYMDDIMDNMTRGEYILLAMRLPKADREEQTDERPETSRFETMAQGPTPMQEVLWTNKAANVPKLPTSHHQGPKMAVETQDPYQQFISTIATV